MDPLVKVKARLRCSEVGRLEMRKKRKQRKRETHKYKLQRRK